MKVVIFPEGVPDILLEFVNTDNFIKSRTEDMIQKIDNCSIDFYQERDDDDDYWYRKYKKTHLFKGPSIAGVTSYTAHYSKKNIACPVFVIDVDTERPWTVIRHHTNEGELHEEIRYLNYDCITKYWEYKCVNPELNYYEKKEQSANLESNEEETDKIKIISFE